MGVPFIDLRRFEAGYLDRWLERCQEVAANTRFVGGPDVARLEARLTEAAGVAVVAAFVIEGVRIVPQQYAFVVERLGRFHAVLEPVELALLHHQPLETGTDLGRGPVGLIHGEIYFTAAGPEKSVVTYFDLVIFLLCFQDLNLSSEGIEYPNLS